MKDALDFWLFFLEMMVSVAWIGVLLIGPAVPIILLTGSAWAGFAVAMVALAAFVTLSTWRPTPHWARWVFWPFRSD